MSDHTDHYSTFRARYHQSLGRKWSEDARYFLLAALGKEPKSSYWMEEAKHYQLATAKHYALARQEMGVL